MIDALFFGIFAHKTSSIDPAQKQKPPLNDKERFTLEYKNVTDEIRHYSTTRSALTSFLMTVGLTLLANYFNKSYLQNRLFLLWAGILLLIAALLVCLHFSYLTERSVMHLKALWKWSKAEQSEYPDRSKLQPKLIRARVFCDRMNLLLIFTIIVIFGVFAFAWIGSQCR
jgi:hypothetical protein